MGLVTMEWPGAVNGLSNYGEVLLEEKQRQKRGVSVCKWEMTAFAFIRLNKHKETLGLV